MSYFVYFLLNTHNRRTYLGITNNLERRIRQHNCMIKGGARYTRSFKGEGVWKYYFLIGNLTKKESLSIERTAKNLGRRSRGKTSVAKRMSVLMAIIDNNTKYSGTYEYSSWINRYTQKSVTCMYKKKQQNTRPTIIQ